MAKIAFIFPGQGSQYAGMGRQLAADYPVAAKTFQEADDALGTELSRLCFEGPESELKLTANTQPAILAHSVAVFRVLADHGLKPEFVAGHSLGEYSALVCARALEFADALRLVRRRGELMQEAVPEGEGAMAAILGVSADVLTQICTEAAQGQVCAPANFNSPEQIVIAGNKAAVERAVSTVSARGGRAIPLPVSAPFHCSLMQPAQKRLEPSIRQLKFRDLQFPLITNVDAEAVMRAAEAQDALIRQVVATVQWERSMRRLIELGVDTFIEAGPGRVLCGLMRRIDRSRKCQSVEDPAGVKAVLKASAA